MHHRHSWTLLLLALSWAALTWVALPDRLPADPLPGGEVQVNVFTTSDQEDAAVAAAGDGSFVVVWESYFQDGDLAGVWARRLAADGSPDGGEFQVSTATLGWQEDAAVAAHGDGGFVVAWESEGQDGSGDSVHAQRFDASNSPLGAEIQVNTFTGLDQDSPAVAAGPDGGFVVVWESDVQDGSGDSVHAQRFDAGGSPLGDEMMLNVFFTADQDDPVVGFDAAGNFVVAWESYSQDGSFDSVQVRRFDAGGAPLTGEIQANTFTTGFQTAPAIAVGADGAFVVVWQSEGQDGDGTSVHGRRFDAGGAPQGDEFQVNVSTTGDQDTPSVAVGPTGGFVVVWESYGTDGDGDSVQARRFRADGSPDGTEFQVNAFTDFDQEDPVVAVDAAGNFLVAWESLSQDGAADSIQAQHYLAEVFADGFESGDMTAWPTAVP